MRAWRWRSPFFFSFSFLMVWLGFAVFGVVRLRRYLTEGEFDDLDVEASDTELGASWVCILI